MGVRINTNVEALNAQRNLNLTGLQFGKSVEKLSSGLRINRGADDPAGLIASQSLYATLAALDAETTANQRASQQATTADAAAAVNRPTNRPPRSEPELHSARHHPTSPDTHGPSR